MRVDREAQRAIRERTKNQIQTLERRIEELTNLQPYQELQAVIEAKEAVERELADVRQRLATIMSMLQPLLGTSQPTSINTKLLTSPGPLSDPQAPNTQPDRRALSPTGGPQAYSANLASLPHQVPKGHAAQRRSDLDQQREQLRHGLDMGPERLGLGFLLDAGHQVSRIQGSVHGALDTPQYRQGGGGGGGGSSTYSNSPGRTQTKAWTPGSSSSAPYFPSGYPYQDPQRTSGADCDATSNSDEVVDLGAGASIPRFAAPVRTTPPTCPLDSLLLDFLGERRQRAAEGLPVHEVLGPRYPSVSSLLNPAHSVYSHPLSRVFTDILAKFPDISGLPERVAVLYIMFLMMRWQVSPTRENYERLPPWVRPLRAQLLSPHPAWIDHLPFPRMREVLVSAYRDPGSPAAAEYPFDNFFIPYTTTLTLSWPYHDTDTLLQSPHSEELMINPVFERHLRNLENWRLGEAFARAFPGLAETCNVPERELAAARAARGYGQSPGVQQ